MTKQGDIWNHRRTNKEELQQRNRLRTASRKPSRGEWGLNLFYLRETSPLILMQVQSA